MSWRVAVVSHARPGTLASKTLPLLASRRVPLDRVDVFAAPAELDDYRPVLPPAVSLHAGALGMAANRNAAAAHYPAGTPIAWCDDDLEDVLALDSTGKKLVPLPDLAALFDRGFSDLDSTGLSLWGIYPAANAFYMRPRVKTGLLFVVGSMWGAITRHDDSGLVTTDEKEDYERTLLRWEADGAVLRYENITVRTRYYKEPGGMQTTRSPADSWRAYEYLSGRWPGLVHLNNNRSGPRAEVVLRAPKGTSS